HAACGLPGGRWHPHGRRATALATLPPRVDHSGLIAGGAAADGLTVRGPRLPDRDGYDNRAPSGGIAAGPAGPPTACVHHPYAQRPARDLPSRPIWVACPPAGPCL